MTVWVSRKNWYHILAGICNYKISAMICKKLRLPEDPVLRLSDQTRKKQAEAVSRQLKQTELSITGTRHMEQGAGDLRRRPTGGDWHRYAGPKRFRGHISP